MRAVHIVASYDNDRELEAVLVRVNQHLCSCLACCIRVCGREDTRLKQLILVVLNFAVHLVCGDVDETLDSHFLGALKQDMCAIDIRMGETIGISKTQVDMGLSGKVQDCVNVVALHTIHHLSGTGDVSMVKGKIAPIIQNSCIVQ